MQKDIQVKDRETLFQIIDQISMKNTALDFKWKFEVSHIIYDPVTNVQGWFITVSFERPDTATGQIGIGRGRPEWVPFGAWESGIVKTCWLLIELVVRHELMEAFRYQDKRIFNPHNSVHALASIQKAEDPPQIDRQGLFDRRKDAAERNFACTNFVNLKESDSGWSQNGDTWSKKLYWVSRNGSFSVRFIEDSAEIIETKCE